MTIYPTGTCFDDVLDHQCEQLKFNPFTILTQHIVHGICLHPEGPKADQPFAHGWVEDDLEERVYQSGLLEDGEKVWWSADRAEWYVMMRVQEKTRYTFHEALRMNWETNHFGPWVEAYRVLCGRASCGG